MNYKDPVKLNVATCIVVLSDLYYTHLVGLFLYNIFCKAIPAFISSRCRNSIRNNSKDISPLWDSLLTTPSIAETAERNVRFKKKFCIRKAKPEDVKINLS